MFNGNGLRKNSEYFDVPLNCAPTTGESRALRAHKLILPAYCAVFRDMFRQNKKTQAQQEILLLLKGVSSIDLSNLLEFMYNGEVNVSKANLNSFFIVDRGTPSHRFTIEQ